MGVKTREEKAHSQTGREMQITPPVITSPKAGVEKKLAKDWEIMEEKRMKCPHCGKGISDREVAVHLAQKGGRIGGKSTSPQKKLASRANGKLGGRPKKKTK